MDIYQLQVFSSVYRLRSFSRASEELNLTQPTVSMHIKRLEEELGVSLFDRAGRTTTPTKEAGALYAKAEELIEKLGDIRTEFGKRRDEPVEGLLTVGTSSSTGSYLIPCLAAEFRKLYPKVFFQLALKSNAAIHAEIAKGHMYLGIVEEAKERAGISLMHTIEDEMVLVTAPGYVKGKAITPIGLMRLPFLMREEDSDARRSMEKEHLIHRITLKGLNVVALLGSTDALKEAVKAGLGAAILSKFTVKDDLRAGLMDHVRVRGVRMRRTLHVIAGEGRKLPRTYGAFADYIKEALPLK